MPFSYVGTALSVYGALKGGKNGGTSGGNSPNAYQMTASPAMDQNFQNAYNSTQTNIDQNQALTNPYSQQLLQGQFNNPYQQTLMDAAHNAQMGYGTAANQTAVAAQYMGQNADQMMALQRQQQDRYNANYGLTQQDTNNMRQMGMDSNQAYDKLYLQQQAQGANVNKASDSLYGAGTNALNTTNQLTGFLQNQQGTIQDAMAQGNQAGSNAYSTTNNLVGMQQGQAGNVYGQANQLYGSASQLQNDAFDPQQALYRQNVGDLTENIRAGEYARGIQMSPAGASVEANALGRFQNDWQNQQLGREAQGVSAASGAAQSAQGMTNSFGNNISGLQAQGYGTGQSQQLGAQSMADTYAQNVAGVQGRGYGTAASANQSAFGMQDAYTQMMAGITNGKDAQYANMSQAANANISGFLNNQSNNANSMSGAINNAYRGQSDLSGASANYYGQAGQVPYNAYQQNAGYQQQGLQNYNTNQQPYLSGLSQQQNAALGYINGAQGLQNNGFYQNAYNQNQMNTAIGQMAGPLGSAAQNLWNKYQGYGGSTGGAGNQFNGYGNSVGNVTDTGSGQFGPVTVDSSIGW